MAGHRAIFLDRDGVITRERADYVKSPDEIEILAGVPNAIRIMQEKGFLIVVVTNQSLVGRGLATEKELQLIHDKMTEELSKSRCRIDAIYYCPHSPEDDCTCRKPKPGLILRAAKDLGLDVSKSWLIGDKETDMEAARRAGCRGVRISTNQCELEAAANGIFWYEGPNLGS